MKLYLHLVSSSYLLNHVCGLHILWASTYIELGELTRRELGRAAHHIAVDKALDRH